MPAIFGKRCDGFERPRSQHRKFRNGHITKFAGYLSRVQKQAQIGRKNSRQVCRAARRTKARSSSEVTPRAACGGSFSQFETALLVAHKSKIGSAAANARGRPNQTSSPVPSASAGVQFR